MKDEFSKKHDWVVAELNPNRDLLVSLDARLASENTLAQLFKNAKINLSFFGFGIEVSESVPISDIEVAIQEMLTTLQKHNRRLLVIIDEVSNTQFMREFASAFQIFVRSGLPIYLLAAGLHENIRDLKNTENLTFLYRAPKIELGSLSMSAIVNRYQSTFDIPIEKAREMAKLTRGYSFAFQLLGYLSWENDGKYEEIISMYRERLDQYVYSKIWSELSNKDKEVIHAIATVENKKVKDVRAQLEMSTNEFNPYRMRLIEKGLVNGETHGFVYFTLPLFEDFVLNQMY